MAALLLELFSEEIPARMQTRAATDLKRATEAMLGEANLSFDKVEVEVTPRRLALTAEGLPLSQPDSTTERKGPKVGAPDAAAQGFLK
ncbi:MAG: glycine--tRNA ligase subunit beta, partial [Planctomycetes bacterium]|nr:glycine--tRNA ligase subunit beta [Planctomycetota bacterium]